MNLNNSKTLNNYITGCLFLIFFPLTSSSGQVKNIGLPFINNYTREDYHAGIQNWAIAQDADGIMYFANNDGMLVFDGNKWQIHPLPNNSIVRCVACFENKIYVGGYDEFGYFEEDSIGSLKYHSLSKKTSGHDSDFGEIWRIFMTQDGIVFQSFLKIFIVHNNNIEVLQPKSQFGFSYFVNNKVFVVDRENGLFVLKNKELIPYYTNNTFFKTNEITFFISKETDQYLIGTTNNGVYILDGKSLTEMPSEINKLLKKDQIYTAIELSNGLLAIGSIQNGLYILNNQDKIIQHINRYKGLQNNTILSLYYDNYQNLWLGLDNGIDMIEISSPLSNLNYCYNIEAAYTSIVNKGILYIGTNQGLFAKKLESVENHFSVDSGFKLVEGTMGQVWSLKIFDDELFCGHNLGTFIIKGEKAFMVSDVQGGWDYTRLKKNENYFVGGTYNGLILFKKSNTSPYGWEYKGMIGNFRESCKEIVSDPDGSLWITHGYKGVFRITLSEDYTQVINSTLYGPSNGLPSLPYSVTSIQDQTVLVTNDLFFTYDKTNNRFIKYDKLNKIFNGISGIKKVTEDYRSNLWYFTTKDMGVLYLQENGTYARIDLPFMRISNQFIGSFENVYVYDKNVVFIGSQIGMIHYDPSMIKNFKPSYSTFMGQVVIKGKARDSAIYIKGNLPPEEKSAVPNIPFKYNSISLSYLSPFFEAPLQITYSYRLIGFDDAWSDWTRRTVKEYTNLPEGEYVFEVKAKNIYDNQSKIAQYAFVIKPPLHRTKLAYFIYVVLIVLIGILNLWYFRRRIERTRQYEKLKHKKELIAKEIKFKEEAELSEQEIEKLKNEKLLSEMRHKNMELANSAMHLIQKNKFLTDLKTELLSMQPKAAGKNAQYNLKTIVRKIDKDIKNEKQLQVFDKYFDDVHQDFIKRLKERHPELTPKDLRMCSYLKMNISTKEIAPLLNVSVRGVEISRYRLRKKLKLDRNANLTEYILSI